MKKFLFFILVSNLISISGISDHAYSQQVFGASAKDTLFEQKLAGKKIRIITANYNGSPFLYDEWCNGDIRLVTDKWVKNKQLKYNTFTDELIWLRPLDYCMIEIEKEQILEFRLNAGEPQKSLQFKKMNFEKPGSDDKFYQVLYEGKYGVYCNRRLIHSEDAVRKGDNGNFSVPILKKAPVYIIASGSGNIMSLDKLTIKELIKSYPNDKKVLKNLLRKRHIHLKSEEDLVTVINIFEEYDLLNKDRNFQKEL